MGTNQKQEFDPVELENAQLLWEKFTVISKWATVAICIVLAILALTLVN
ncbi:MAG: aa3-type cytochrome c oxidase subunit IV [Pseudomonadota bacterium]